MGAVKSKWWSPRAVLLHFALILWVAMCILCAWWQVGRAIQGNTLSYMYSIEWPCFAILGVVGWFALVNAEAPTEDQEAERRAYEERMREQALRARRASAEGEDPTLAAYNDHLASLATKPRKRLWGH